MLLCEVGLRYEARGLARKQNAGLLVGSPSFADTASRSRSQPKMEDNLFTSPKGIKVFPISAKTGEGMTGW